MTRPPQTDLVKLCEDILMAPYRYGGMMQDTADDAQPRTRHQCEKCEDGLIEFDVGGGETGFELCDCPLGDKRRDDGQDEPPDRDDDGDFDVWEERHL
jgi:hypothetical protein